MMKPRIRTGRKLLVASLGVAAVSYVSCGGSGDGGGGGGSGGAVGNLVGPDQDVVTQPDAQSETSTGLDAVANLVAPDPDAATE